MEHNIVYETSMPKKSDQTTARNGILLITEQTTQISTVPTNSIDLSVGEATFITDISDTSKKTSTTMILTNITLVWIALNSLDQFLLLKKHEIY